MLVFLKCLTHFYHSVGQLRYFIGVTYQHIKNLCSELWNVPFNHKFGISAIFLFPASDVFLVN